MTSITFYSQYGEYSITVNKDDMNMEEIMGELVRPLLLAAGFQPENISEYINA